MKILHIIGGFNYGGAEQFILNLYHHIDRENVQFDVITRSYNSNQADEFTALGGRVYVSPAFPKHCIANYYFMKNYFMKHLQEYDALHIHANALMYIIPIILARRFRCKNIIVHSHNTRARMVSLLHFFNRFFLRYVHHNIACGEDAGNWMFGTRDFRVVHNGIELERYLYRQDIAKSKRIELNIAENDFVIGHVGRLVEQKNHKKIIDVFVEVLKLKGNAKLLLIGSGELEKDVIAYLEKRELLNKVIMLKNRRDVPEILNCMDVFLFPSLYEGLSIALIEAQAVGLNCVVSDTVDNQSIINRNVVALPLYEADEIWAQKIVELAKNYHREKAAFSNIRKNCFDISSTVKSMLEIYGNKLEV